MAIIDVCLIQVVELVGDVHPTEQCTMKLTFLGTRGYIEPKSRRHRMHTSLLVAYGGKRVMIDCGETWLGKLAAISPHAIVITHAHPDHVGGLKDGARCPVYATSEAWKGIGRAPIKKRLTIAPRKAFAIDGIRFEAFGLEHSILAPAVGYRISAGRATIFYAPDVVYIHDRAAAFAGVRLYVGDGATLRRQFVRRRDRRLIGHAPVETQLTWCKKEGVPRAIITHCGSEIVAGGEKKARDRLAEMAAQRGVEALIACDGMELVLR
jgi:phosphoribosyl 1,2-cyclic phosphodiesterase